MFKNILDLFAPGPTVALKTDKVTKPYVNPRWLFILDPGHGGIVNGNYVTAGKRSPKFEDGTVLCEGVNNRKNVNLVLKIAKNVGLNVIDIVSSENDVALQTRVQNANKYGQRAVYISFHSDAAGDGVNWHSAKGITVFTTKGQTLSDKFADLVYANLRGQFPELNMRQDMTDGDGDKEEDFFVLRKTVMPSVLLELGFHTNYDEAKFIMTETFRNKMAKAVVDSMLQWEKLMP